MPVTNIRFLAVLAVLSCAGCGQFVDMKSSLEAYRAASPCCTSFAELKYEQLTYPADLSISIDDHSPVFDFDRAGKSRFAAFELPQPGTPYRLVLRSYLLGDGLFDKAAFFPLVTFLDADKKPFYTSSALLLKFVPFTLTNEPSEPSRLEFARVIMPPDPERYETPARYIVIHTSRELIESGGYASQVGPVRIAASSTYIPIIIPVPAGPSGPTHRAGSPIGALRLRLEQPGP
jgi:hypothetical protein